MDKEFDVWECKLVIDGDLPRIKGFDAIPRMAAIEAVEDAGRKVISCFTGWGGKLDVFEKELVEKDALKLKEEVMETVELDLDEETLLFLTRAAHERDITLNALMVEIIKRKIEEEEFLEN